MSTRVTLAPGANRGIGRELSRQLAAAGDTVNLTARDPLTACGDRIKRFSSRRDSGTPVDSNGSSRTGLRAPHATTILRRELSRRRSESGSLASWAGEKFRSERLRVRATKTPAGASLAAHCGCDPGVGGMLTGGEKQVRARALRVDRSTTLDRCTPNARSLGRSRQRWRGPVSRVVWSRRRFEHASPQLLSSSPLGAEAA